MSFEDEDYFYRRAEAELEMAERTDNPAAVAAHVTIAERYIEMAGADRRVEAARAATDGLKPVGA